jgi:hypothetical protein
MSAFGRFLRAGETRPFADIALAREQTPWQLWMRTFSV